METHSIFKAVLLRATVIAGMALAISGAGPAAAVDKALEVQIESMQDELIRIKSQMQSIAAEPKSNTGCIATAKGGIQVSCDNGFTAKAGGRLMMDAAFYGSDNVSGATKLGDGTEMRRARLFLAGTLFNENWAYKTEIDFAENAVASKDIWLQYKGLKAFNNLSIKVGNQKEPFGLENMTSSRFITFMERADHNGLFWQGKNRRLGLSGNVHGDNWGTSAGVFGARLSDDPTSEGDEQWTTTGRVHFAPLAEKTRNVHLGFSGLYRNPNKDSNDINLEVRPDGSHITDIKFVNTGALASIDNEFLFAPEFAAVYGPVSVQTEYTRGTFTRNTGLNDLNFSNFYGYASFFLTGESRAYNAKEGAFDRIKPNKNLSDGGVGAWEVGLRFDATDASDENVLGGEQDTWTVGLNWHPNPYIRFMANYANTDGDINANDAGSTIGNEDVDAFQLRAQIDF